MKHILITFMLFLNLNIQANEVKSAKLKATGPLSHKTDALMNAGHSFVFQNGKKIKLKIARTLEEQTKGLSGIQDKDFSNDEGVLFVYKEMRQLGFWMPDTYFNLDIVFLDANFKIVGVEKNVPFHPGLKEPPAIYQTKMYTAQYVLETKSSSWASKFYKVGTTLSLEGLL